MVRLMTSLALALLTSVGVQAQTYPSRSAAVIVPFSPGGPTDAIGRIVADIFTRHLGQQFIVINVGGAGAPPAHCEPRAPGPTDTLLSWATWAPMRRLPRSIPIWATTQ